MRRHILWALVLLVPLLAAAQDLEEFEKRVTEFTLSNGMHFIVLERHQAPVVSFYAYVDAGSVNDPGGKTGLAHMFEHMIGKGTSEVGTTDWAAEQAALARVEEAYDALEDEQRKGLRADPDALKRLEANVTDARATANSYVVPNQFPQVVAESGGVGFNAGTGTDSTVYYYSLPANRVELWFNLQSEWFREPVYREFYKERDVVREERRMRVESNPQGMLQEAHIAAAFIAHPYRTLIGWASDIENLRASDAARFHQSYYVPSNITIGIAGDVDPAWIRELAEKYYGRIPAGSTPPEVITEEPPQQGERRIAIESPARPFLLVTWQRPDQRHPDDPVFDVINSILSSGRTGYLYTDLVRDRQLALAVDAVATFPAAKYPNLFAILALPNAGRTVEENEQAIYENLDRLKNEKVDDEILERVKTKIRASIIRQLDSNLGLATQLAFYHVNYGDWRVLFHAIDIIGKVTADDVQRVARQYFTPKTRTVSYLVSPQSEEESQ